MEFEFLCDSFLKLSIHILFGNKNTASHKKRHENCFLENQIIPKNYTLPYITPSSRVLLLPELSSFLL